MQLTLNMAFHIVMEKMILYTFTIFPIISAHFQKKEKNAQEWLI